MPAMMSLFSAATPSVFFRNSRWLSAMEVRMAPSGLEILESSPISPNWLVPISMTHHRAFGLARSRVSGTPNKLLRFPRVAWVFLSIIRQSRDSSSLVEVFPLLPVIPSTFPEYCSRARDAHSRRARLGSATRIWGKGV